MSGISAVRRALRALPEIPPPGQPLPRALVEAGESFARGRIHRLTTFPHASYPCLVISEGWPNLVVLPEGVAPPAVMSLGAVALRHSLLLFLDQPAGTTTEAYARVESLRVPSDRRITDLVSMTERMRLFRAGMPVEPVEVYLPASGSSELALGHGLHRAVAASQLEAEYLRARVHLDTHHLTGPRPVSEIPFPSMPQQLTHLPQAHWNDARREALRQDFMANAMSMSRFLYMGVSLEEREAVLETGLKADGNAEAVPIEEGRTAFSSPYLALYDRTVYTAGDRARAFRYLIECATGRVLVSRRFE